MRPMRARQDWKPSASSRNTRGLLWNWTVLAAWRVAPRTRRRRGWFSEIDFAESFNSARRVVVSSHYPRPVALELAVLVLRAGAAIPGVCMATCFVGVAGGEACALLIIMSSHFIADWFCFSGQAGQAGPMNILQSAIGGNLHAALHQFPGCSRMAIQREVRSETQKTDGHRRVHPCDELAEGLDVRLVDAGNDKDSELP